MLSRVVHATGIMARWPLLRELLGSIRDVTALIAATVVNVVLLMTVLFISYK